MTVPPSLPDTRKPAPPASAESLFRKQVLAARYAIVDAPLRLRAPAMHAAATGLLLSVVLGGFWLARQPYAEKLTVSGFAQRASGRIAIRAPQAGTVYELAVRDGEWVERGAVLVRLSADSMLNSGSSAALARQRALEREQQALHESSRLAQQRHQRAAKRIDATLSHGATQRAQLRLEQQTLRTQLQLDQRRLSDIEQLVSQGAVARNEHSTSRRLLLGSQRALHAATRALSEHDAGQKQLRLERELLAQEQAEATARINAALARLDQRRLELQLDAAHHLGAPIGGFVSGVNVRLGQRVQPGQTVLNLLQRQDHANVLLLLPSQAMGNVAVGQNVRLRYAGYPYQKFGTPTGRIERVSKTPVSGAELDLPVNPRALVYPVTVRVLSSPEPHAIARFEPKDVVPGMQVEADVLVRREPLWRWLLQPLLKLWARW